MLRVRFLLSPVVEELNAEVLDDSLDEAVPTDGGVPGADEIGAGLEG